MSQDDPIIFRCEASLWEMLADVGLNGRSAKPFDMRRWDMSDDRMYRLSWLERDESQQQIDPEMYNTTVYVPLQAGWTWQEKEIWFVNKAEPEKDLCFEYRGVEFPNWAPGWGFLILGKRIHPPVEEC